MKKIYIFIAIFLCVFTISAQEILTIDQCRQLALDNNKHMEIASKQTQVAHYTQ